VQGKLGVGGSAGSVHRLQEEMPEREPLELRGISARLRINQLQLVSAPLRQLGSRLRTDAEPVHPGRRGNRSIGLDGNFKIALMQRGYQLVSSCSRGSPPVQTTKRLPNREPF